MPSGVNLLALAGSQHKKLAGFASGLLSYGACSQLFTIGVLREDTLPAVVTHTVKAQLTLLQQHPFVLHLRTSHQNTIPSTGAFQIIEQFEARELQEPLTPRNGSRSVL